MAKLKEIRSEHYDVEIMMAYATPDNFTGKPLYKRPACFLHPKAEEALKRAVGYAAHMGYRFRIYDAYRPLEVQQMLWDDTPNHEFLSNPQTGSIPHCRGVAVDLTLLDKHGKPLDMGTHFDAFTPLSHHGNTEISQEAQRNRAILMGIMCAAGWDFYRNEWWHYQLFDARQYPALKDHEAGTALL
jgi:D-alanyl-D-alanine dipeptidase